MRSLQRLLYAPLAALAISAASAEPVCRTLLPDGRIVLARPFMDQGELSCPRITLPPMATAQRQFGATTLPSTRFTTGQIGPFTTGPIGPLTTFSNSLPPATVPHR
ncbi:MAG TPA: hypothetical protein VF502_12225 [Stellaceae bacterium]